MTIRAHRIGQVTTALVVVFGSVSVQATALTHDMLVAITPPMAVAGHVAASLSSHGARLGGVSVPFLYLPVPQVSRVFPLGSPAAGGARVTVMATGFEQWSSWHCVFGEQVVVARAFVTQNRLECDAPAVAVPNATTVRFGLATSLEALPLWSSFSFVYVPTAHVQSLAPAKGPTSGRTRVVVTISHRSGHLSDAWRGYHPPLATLEQEPPPTQYHCAFGHDRVPASFTDSTASTVACISPAALPGRVQVRIVLSFGQTLEPPVGDGSRTDGYNTFEYVPCPPLLISLGQPVAPYPPPVLPSLPFNWDT